MSWKNKLKGLSEGFETKEFDAVMAACFLLGGVVSGSVLGLVGALYAAYQFSQKQSAE